MRKRIETEKVEETDRGPFTLSLPTELNPVPQWVVDLPNGVKAEVFRAKVGSDRYDQGDLIDGFKIVVVNSEGQIVSCDAKRDEIEVRNALRALARHHGIKKRRQVMTVEDHYD